MSAVIPRPKIITRKLQSSDKVPAKAEVREELKRLADLALTISKRIRQLEDVLVTTK